MRTTLFISLMGITLLSSCRVSEETVPIEVERIKQEVTCSGSLVIEGKFQGKNIYVQNPIGENDYCVCQIIVNDSLFGPETYNSSAFEINLIEMKLKLGANVKIQMTHYGDCKPKVLNPEVH